MTPKGVLPNQSDLPPVASPYPIDIGGRAVERAVAPNLPALPPTERFGTAPMPRIIPTRLLNPEANANVNLALPPVMPAKPVPALLVQPPERVPFDIGNGAAALPAKPALPVAAAVTERSRDVNLPPPLPMLGRPLADRVSLDDPTAELSNAAIANAPVKVPLTSAAFLRVWLPDPFELAEQIKPKVPPSAEPGLSPVPVNPRRVK
jgi:hypothetical protein